MVCRGVFHLLAGVLHLEVSRLRLGESGEMGKATAQLPKECTYQMLDSKGANGIIMSIKL